MLRNTMKAREGDKNAKDYAILCLNVVLTLYYIHTILW